MCSESAISCFLTAIDCWNNNRRNLREIPATDVYLNLLYDLGSRLPKNEESRYNSNKIPIEQRKHTLSNRLHQRINYLVYTVGLNEDLVIDFLMISMNKFLNNMLERLVIRKLSYITTCGYICNTTLITNDDQKKLLESKQLWEKIINKQMSITSNSLILFDNADVYTYDTLDTTYNFLNLINISNCTTTTVHNSPSESNDS